MTVPRRVINYFIFLDRTVSEKEVRKELETESEQGHLLGADKQAESHGLQKKEVTEAQFKGLWEMAAVNRNAPSTKKLAQEYWLSKQELKEFLYYTQLGHDLNSLKIL